MIRSTHWRRSGRFFPGFFTVAALPAVLSIVFDGQESASTRTIAGVAIALGVASWIVYFTWRVGSRRVKHRH